MSEQVLYKNINELLSLAHKELRILPNANMDFVVDVAMQYEERHSLSPKQIKVLERIAKKELDRRKEMQLVEPLF